MAMANELVWADERLKRRISSAISNILELIESIFENALLSPAQCVFMVSLSAGFFINWSFCRLLWLL